MVPHIRDCMGTAYSILCPSCFLKAAKLEVWNSVICGLTNEPWGQLIHLWYAPPWFFLICLRAFLVMIETNLTAWFIVTPLCPVPGITCDFFFFKHGLTTWCNWPPMRHLLTPRSPEWVLGLQSCVTSLGFFHLLWIHFLESTTWSAWSRFPAEVVGQVDYSQWWMGAVAALDRDRWDF